MGKKMNWAGILLLLTLLNCRFFAAYGQGTAITYQGRLQSGTNIAQGTYSLSFALYTTNANGVISAGPVTNAGVAITNGLFTTLVDFGPGALTSTNYWMQIAVATNGSNVFTQLSPRQPLTPVPYSLYTATAATAGSFSSSLAGDVTGLQTATVVSSVGGVTAANIASGATAANGATTADIPGTIVKRDGSGNFTAGTITASLTGQATSATTAQASAIATNGPNGQSLSVPTPTGQAWAAIQKPMFPIFMDPGVVNGVREGESYITNVVAHLVTNSWWNAATSSCQVAVECDVQLWTNRISKNDPQYRNYYARNWGNLVPDPNLWPDGLGWTVALLASNGISFYPHIYYTIENLTPGADEMLLSPFGGNPPVAYTNGVGPWPMAGSQAYVPCMTRDSLPSDFSELFALGIKGVCLADGPNNNYEQMDADASQYCSTIQMPWSWAKTIPGVGTNNLPYAGYVNVSTNVFDTNSFGYIEYESEWAMGYNMMVMVYESPNQDAAYTDGFRTAYGQSAVFYDNNGNYFGNPGAANVLRSLIRDFPGTTKAYQGAYNDWGGYTSTADACACALSHGFFLGTWSTESVFSGKWQGWTNAISSPNWRRVEFDRDQNWFYIVSDYGQNGGLIAADQLSDGSVCLGAFNEGGSTSNFVVNLTSIGFQTNTAVHVYDVIGGIDRGISVGTYTITLTSGSGTAVIVTPVTPLTDTGTAAVQASQGFWANPGNSVNEQDLPSHTSFYSSSSAAAATGWDNWNLMGTDGNADFTMGWSVGDFGGIQYLGLGNQYGTPLRIDSSSWNVYDTNNFSALGITVTNTLTAGNIVIAGPNGGVTISGGGTYTGNASGLTNVQASAISGGLTTIVPFLVPGGTTNFLCITNGIIMRIQQTQN